jgi:putative acetyltransferase
MASPDVRLEAPADHAAIHAANVLAFGRQDEANLVAALRDAGALAVSCVAEVDGAVVGHVALSPIVVAEGALRGLGLGPMAVVPARQRTGIGTTLGRAALAEARRAGWDAVVVLGHPGYYPRFGFRPASSFGLRCEYDAPDEAFMALELRPGALGGVQGMVRYHPAFGAV